MNLPNKLTLIRIALTPVVVVFLLNESIPHSWLWAGLLFGAAAITDAFDGSIARKRGIVTDFGKLMDPIADKLLVISVFVCFVRLDLCSPWVVIIILAREFLVTSARSVSAERGIIIPANNWGKAKTITQMVAIVFIIVVKYAFYLLPLLGIELPEVFSQYAVISFELFTWLSALITLVSGATYLYGCRDILKDTK